MKALSTRYLLLIIVCSIFFLQTHAQNVFFKMGDDLSKGAAKNIDTIGHHLAGSMRDEITTPESQQKLAHTLDSVLKPSMVSVRQLTADVRDSIINHRLLLFVDSLRNAITGAAMDHNLKILQASVVGKSRQDAMQVLDRAQGLLNGVLSDSTQQKIGALRDELLGSKTNQAITHIVDTVVSHLIDSSMNKLAYRLKTDINPMLEADVSHVQRNLIIVIIAIGVVAIVIILLVWQRKSRYLKLVTLLSKQIHDIPDQQVYDTVTKKVKADATTLGLEPHLRTILNENGLLGSGSWKK